MLTAVCSVLWQVCSENMPWMPAAITVGLHKIVQWSCGCSCHLYLALFRILEYKYQVRWIKGVHYRGWWAHKEFLQDSYRYQSNPLARKLLSFIGEMSLLQNYFWRKVMPQKKQKDLTLYDRISVLLTTPPLVSEKMQNGNVCPIQIVIRIIIKHIYTYIFLFPPLTLLKLTLVAIFWEYIMFQSLFGSLLNILCNHWQPTNLKQKTKDISWS